MDYTCCLCNKDFSGYGNNPAPLESDTKKCCDNCNNSKVIPERIKRWRNQNAKRK